MDLINKINEHKPQELNHISMAVLTGSHLYGTQDDNSDIDIVVVGIPETEILYPYSNGKIFGFDDKNISRFETYQIQDGEYDITYYNIVKFIRLAADNNPNIIELFSTNNYIILDGNFNDCFIENKHMFLNKKLIRDKFLGYAYSQLKKLKDKPHNYKYASHLIRLLLFCGDLLKDGKINFFEHMHHLITVKSGKYSILEIENMVSHLLKVNENLYESSTLPEKSSDNQIRRYLNEYFYRYGIRFYDKA